MQKMQKTSRIPLSCLSLGPRSENRGTWTINYMELNHNCPPSARRLRSADTTPRCEDVDLTDVGSLFQDLLSWENPQWSHGLELTTMFLTQKSQKTSLLLCSWNKTLQNSKTLQDTWHIHITKTTCVALAAIERPTVIADPSYEPPFSWGNFNFPAAMCDSRKVISFQMLSHFVTGGFP